jgi:hypothetical protein
MKNIITLLLLGTSLSGLAQNGSEVKRTYAIRTNLLSAIYNTVNVSYQKLKPNGNSVVIGASYMDFNDFNRSSNNYYGNNNYTSVGGVALTGEYRLHFSGSGFEGGYVGAFGRAMFYERNAKYQNNIYTSSQQPVEIIDVKEKFNFASVGVGFVVGYQFVIQNRVTFDFFGGPVFQALVYQDKVTRNATTGERLESRKINELANNIPDRYISGYGLRGGITLGILF